VTRAAVLVVFWLLAAGTSCRTPEAKGKTVWVMPADLACVDDADCTIRDADFECCCNCGDGCPPGTEPFAISKRAAATWSARCEGFICTMEACDAPPGKRVEDFRAVCVNRACERRPKG
jgi:hypothetical protein